MGLISDENAEQEKSLIIGDAMNAMIDFLLLQLDRRSFLKPNYSFHHLPNFYFQ